MLELAWGLGKHGPGLLPTQRFAQPDACAPWLPPLCVSECAAVGCSAPDDGLEEQLAVPTPPAGLCQHAWRRGEPGWELLGTRQLGQPCLVLACGAGVGTRVPPPAGF